MPEARLDRTRATLPTGYQFGDLSDANKRRYLEAAEALRQATPLVDLGPDIRAALLNMTPDEPSEDSLWGI